MNPQITVSVVIPCYNSESTILQCISSVLQQTFKEFEILIIDDGSNDNTSSIVESLIKTKGRSHHITLIRQKNSGPSVARNVGVQKSRGKWIAFLDSDDYWAPFKLEKQLEVITKTPQLFLVGSKSYERKDGQYKYTDISFGRLLYTNVFKTSSVIIKTEIALLYPFEENMKYSEDYRVWLLVAQKYRVGLIHGNLCGSIRTANTKYKVGLSSNLKAMAEGEASNYTYLYKAGLLGRGDYLMCTVWSYIKYLRRKAIKLAWQFN